MNNGKTGEKHLPLLKFILSDLEFINGYNHFRIFYKVGTFKWLGDMFETNIKECLQFIKEIIENLLFEKWCFYQNEILL